MKPTTNSNPAYTVTILRPDEPRPMHIIACPICDRLTTRVVCTLCARR